MRKYNNISISLLYILFPLSQQSNVTSLNVFKAQNFYSGSQAGTVKLIETLSVFMYSSDFQCGGWSVIAQFVCKNNSNQFSLRWDEVSKSVMKRVRSVNAVNNFVIGPCVPQLLSELDHYWSVSLNTFSLSQVHFSQVFFCQKVSGEIWVGWQEFGSFLA